MASKYAIIRSLRPQLVLLCIAYYCNCVTGSTVVIRSLSSTQFQQQSGSNAILADEVSPSVPVNTREFSIPSNTTVSLSWENIPSSVRYVLFQAHSHAFPILMSYDVKLVTGNYVNSTNAGLVVLLAPSTVNALVYVHNRNNVDLNILLVITSYTWPNPIVGGCNMEFDVEIAPYLRVTFNNLKITVDYQRSLEGYERGSPAPPTCDQSMASLEYNVYQYFMKEKDQSQEEYFRAIRNMLTVESIQKNALEIGPMQLGPITRVRFTSNPGQGVVYNVVARNVYNNSLASSYTPAVTYGCHLLEDSNTCQNTIHPFGWFLSVLSAITGLFLCFFGHRYFKFEMFLFGFLGSSLLGYIFISAFSQSTYSINVLGTIFLGLIGGTLWLAFWWFAGVPVLSLLVVGFVFGFQIACVVYYTPFGELAVLQNDFNYWMIFTCIMLLPMLFFMCCIRKLSIVSCAVVGSYGTVLLLDRLLGSSLVYIVYNVIKRATVEEFYLLNTATPFQLNDIVLSCVWGLLSASGILFQVIREKKRPPFPPPPYLLWKATLDGRGTLGTFPYTMDNEERQPLLSESSPQHDYNSTSWSSGQPRHSGQIIVET